MESAALNHHVFFFFPGQPPEQPTQRNVHFMWGVEGRRIIT